MAVITAAVARAGAGAPGWALMTAAWRVGLSWAILSQHPGPPADHRRRSVVDPAAAPAGDPRPARGALLMATGGARARNSLSGVARLSAARTYLLFAALLGSSPPPPPSPVIRKDARDACGGPFLQQSMGGYLTPSELALCGSGSRRSFCYCFSTNYVNEDCHRF